ASSSGFTRLCRLKMAIWASSWFATGSRGTTARKPSRPASLVCSQSVRNLSNSKTKRSRRKSEAGGLPWADFASAHKSRMRIVFSVLEQRLGHAAQAARLRPRRFLQRRDLARRLRLTAQSTPEGRMHKNRPNLAKSTLTLLQKKNCERFPALARSQRERLSKRDRLEAPMI